MSVGFIDSNAVYLNNIHLNEVTASPQAQDVAAHSDNFLGVN